MAGLNFENVVFPDYVGFRCIKCGFCCRCDPPDVSWKERQKIESAGFKDFLEASAELGETCIRRKADGSCFFFAEGNACGIQGIKPSTCRLEPFIITDYDDKTGRIFLGVNPLAATTCKGIFTGEMSAPEEIGKAAQTTIKEILEIVAKKTGLPVTDKKVISLTRKIIIHLNFNETY